MCRGTQTHTLTVVVQVVLQCNLVFMSVDACLMECSFSLYVSYLLNLMAIQVEVCQNLSVWSL